MRLFAGLALPGEAKDRLAAVARLLEPAIPGARWVPRDNFHVTLAFLGTVDDERVPSVLDALRAAGAHATPGRAAIAGLGAFPSTRRARVVWAGLDDPDGVVARVAEAVLGALDAAGFPREQRAFHAHATLARLKDPAPVALDVVAMPASAVAVDRITLFRSHLGRPAPRYEVLEDVPLSADREIR